MSIQPGPTGQFPKGKVIPEDEGELAINFRIGIGLNNDAVVVMEFGKEISWIGLEPDMVDGLCAQLQTSKKQALELLESRKRGET